MDKVVNLRLMTHPANWLLVWIVLSFAGYAWHLIHHAANRPPSTDKNLTQT